MQAVKLTEEQEVSGHRTQQTPPWPHGGSAPTDSLLRGATTGGNTNTVPPQSRPTVLKETTCVTDTTNTINALPQQQGRLLPHLSLGALVAADPGWQQPARIDAVSNCDSVAAKQLWGGRVAGYYACSFSAEQWLQVVAAHTAFSFVIFWDKKDAVNSHSIGGRL